MISSSGRRIYAGVKRIKIGRKMNEILRIKGQINERFAGLKDFHSEIMYAN